MSWTAGGVRVRRAGATDADAVARIYVDSWNQGFGHLLGREEHTGEGRRRWEAELVGEGTDWWVADAAGDVVGVVVIGPSRDPVQDRLGEIDTIAVAPTHWRRAVGRALVDVAVGALASRFDEAVVWTVAGDDQARGFYEATGWCADGGRHDEGRQARSAGE